MTWTLLSILLFILLLSCSLGTDWLTTAPKSLDDPPTKEYRSIGLFSMCTYTEIEDLRPSEYCSWYSMGVVSPYWIACSVFMALALLIIAVVALFSCGALCFRSLGRKSIYSVSGFLQALSGECWRRLALPYENVKIL